MPAVMVHLPCPLAHHMIRAPLRIEADSNLRHLRTAELCLQYPRSAQQDIRNNHEENRGRPAIWNLPHAARARGARMSERARTCILPELLCCKISSKPQEVGAILRNGCHIAVEFSNSLESFPAFGKELLT